MRTRFLPSSVETLGFVQLLPVPHFSVNSDCFSNNFVNCLAEIPVFPQIEKLSIDDALSIFLSDVLPHFITSEESKEVCHGEKQVVRLISGETNQDEASFDNKYENAVDFVQFEIPEVDVSLLPLGKATCSQHDNSHIFFKISKTESTLDMQRTELMLFDHLEIQQSVYSVDVMSMECLTEKKADSTEDGYSIQGEQHTRNHDFPLLEVNEESMDNVSRIYVVDEIQNFDYIEKEKLTPPAEEIGSNTDLLGSKGFDFAKDLLNYCAAVKCFEEADFSPSLDDISIIDLSHHHECSLSYDGRKQQELIWSRHPSFNEFLFFDFDLYNIHEVVLDVAKHMEAETCDSMFGEAMNFKSMNELVVSHELTIMDEYFKSLPVPIFSDLRHIRPLHLLVEECFAQLEWQSSSASDGLYLDWHYLGEDGRDLMKSSSCWKMLWDIDSYNTKAALNLSVSDKLIFDFILYEDCSDKSTTETNKEMLNISANDIPVVYASAVEAEPTSSISHRHGQKINEDFAKNSIEKCLLFGESMSSDLEFFLNPRINITGRESVPASKSMDVTTVHQMLKSSDDPTATTATTTYEKKRDIQLHKVKLSDNIILLIDYLQKHFLALWENDEELILMNNRIQAGDDLTVLQISKEELIRRINEKSDSATYISDNDDHIIILSVLYAIKQMAFYLCYYGVQAAFLYIDKLIRNLPCVKSRLIFLYKLIRDEQEKSEKELSIVHPSITVVQEILQRNSSKRSSKILIVADQVFWQPLEKLMTSLKMSYNEPECLAIHPSQRHQCSEIDDNTVDIMLGSDCCLVSIDYVSASIPFSKFSLILEYGGSSVSSRVSSFFLKLDVLPTLYFVKVELVEPIARALSDSICMTKSMDLKLKKTRGCTMGQGHCKWKLEQILNAKPVKDAAGCNGHVKFVNDDEECTMMPVQSIPVCSELKQNLPMPNSPCKSICLDTVIIVNTRNFSEEMVISRRSTYLRILKMEKQGSQVVERDISLPVDIIASAAVSLTWYDSMNIWKKASTLDEALSSLSSCVESIAASILTSLSFSFSCCILIFEGEGSFLTSIMESSDELYAAAATLGIEIQLFCSYSSEMTEEIILSCIKCAAKLSNGLYPKMSDSESLAESFLNAFPSVNPLCAHAILSSGETLGKFLELSNEGRISALNKYQVRNEIIALLNSTSRYGEREDCKSGTTDCSSSVSSVPDSENIQLKIASERKKPKHTHGFLDTNQLAEHMKSWNQLPEDHLNRTHWPVSRNSLNMAQTREAETKAQKSSFNRYGNNPGQFNSSFDELFNFEKFDANSFETVEFDAKGFEIPDVMDKTWIHVIDEEGTPERRSPTVAMKNVIEQSMKAPDTRYDYYIGEVIDIDDSPPFWRTDYAVKQNYHAGMATAPETSIREDNCLTFTESASIDRKSNSLRYQRRLVKEDMTRSVPQDTNNLSFKRSRESNSVDTPLSNALHSTHAQQGTPWTIEFLNRIREKSRLHQQSNPCNLNSPSFGLPEKTSKFVKRKSPSIFEFYKYEGSSPNKQVDIRTQKRNSTPLKKSLKNDRASASSMPQWTPVDKRARRTLSFSSNGSGGQRKLIWTDNNPHNSQRGF